MTNVVLRTPGTVLNTWRFRTATDLTCTGTDRILISNTITLAGNSILQFSYSEPNLARSQWTTNPIYTISVTGVTIPLDTNHMFYASGDLGFQMRSGISWITYSNTVTVTGSVSITLTGNRYDTGAVIFGFQGRAGTLIVTEIAL